MNIPDHQNSDDLPDDATCLQCGYSLRHTQSNLCPECGKLFSPSRRLTYDRPRPELFRTLTSPSGIGELAVIIILLCIPAGLLFFWIRAFINASTYVGKAYGLVIGGMLLVIGCGVLFGICNIKFWNDR